VVIVGVGTDLVAVARFHRLIDRSGRMFLERWFSPAEVAYCLSCCEPARHAAARFAAKEATLKSLRVCADGPLHWAEIEVTRDAHGLPSIQTHGSARRLAESIGVADLHLSLSHDGQYATATVIAVSAA